MSKPFGLFEIITFEVKTAVASFWATCEKNWAIFISASGHAQLYQAALVITHFVRSNPLTLFCQSFASNIKPQSPGANLIKKYQNRVNTLTRNNAL